MRDSAVKDAAGDIIDGVYPSEYTHITKMFSNGVSISEYGNSGGCGPIPYAYDGGYSGDASWEKYVNGSWVHTGAANLWEPDAPGIYRRILTTSNTNTTSNPLAVYVYYAGDLDSSVRSTLGGQLSSIGVTPDTKVFDQSLVVEYRGFMHAQTSYSQSISPIRYTTEMDNEALCAAADEASGKTDAQKLASYYDVSLKNDAMAGAWMRTGTPNVTPTPSATPGNTPNTGDSQNLFLWLFVLLACAAALIGIAAYKKKHE